MSVIYRCKCCSGSHLSPLQVFQESSFHSLKMQNYFDNSYYVCPVTRTMQGYVYEDHFWVDGKQLTKLSGYILQWVKEKDRMDSLFSPVDGELLTPEASPAPPQRLGTDLPKLTSGLLGSKTV